MLFLIETLFLLFLVLILIAVRRNLTTRLFLTAVYFAVVILLKGFEAKLILPWLILYLFVFTLDYLGHSLFNLKQANLKLEYRRAEKDFTKGEQKLNEIEKFNRQLQLEVTKITDFFDISKELTKVMYLKQLPPVLANIVKESFEIKTLALLIFEDNQNHGLFIYPHKNLVDFKENIDYPFIDSEKIISEEEAGFYDGEVLEPLFLKLGYLASKERIYIIPLISEGEMKGLLMLDDLKEDKIDLAHTLAGFLSLNLRKVSLYQKVQELAITDELTQVYVRRHFIKIYKEELDRIKNKNSSACFLMLDLDRFKNCNDTFGHLVGDVVLTETAKIIRENVREIDLVGRYGGEEFCIFLPETKLEDGVYVGERIRKVFERYTFHAYDEVLNITVSIGVSCFPSDTKDDLELIEKADLALYYAKRKGRNRVIAYNSIK